MILLNSLIIVLILLILAQLYKSYYKHRSGSEEGFRQLYQQHELFPIAEGENISNALESRSYSDIMAPNVPLYASEFIQDYALIEGNDISAPASAPAMSASQKAQLKANLQKTGEEAATLGQHKRIMNNALDMDKLKHQIKELMDLSDEAKKINESFTSMQT